MKKNCPVVSMIVPIYNGEKVLKRCVDSILCQTFRDWELLLIDDGSGDKSADICERYAKNDERIRFITKENEGVSATRNRGIKEAKGQYVQFVDCDDYLEASYVETMVSKMVKENADLIITGYTRHKAGKIVEKSPVERNLNGKKELSEHFFTLYNGWYLNTPWNKLYCRDRIREHFPGDMSLGEDLLFNLSYFKQAEKICVMKHTGYHYCIENEQSLGIRYREDKFEHSLMLHEEILRFASETLHIEQEECLADEIFPKEVRFAITSLVGTSQLTPKEKKEKLKQWIANEEVRKGYQRCKNLGMQDRIFRVFILKKWDTLLYYMVKWLKA